MSRLKLSLFNLGSSFLLNLIGIGLTFWSLPIIIDNLSDYHFGVFRALSEWIGFSGVISASLMIYMSQHIARAQSTTERTSFLTGHIRLTTKLIVYLAPVLGLFIYLSPFLLKAPPEAAFSIRLASTLGCLAFAFVPALALQSHFEAQNRAFVVSGAIIYQRILITLLSVAFAVLWKNVESQFFALLLGQAFLAMYLLNRYLSENSLGTFREGLRERSPALGEVWQKLKPYMKIDLAGRLGMAADTLIISLLLSPKEVTLFFIWIRLPNLIMGQLMTFGNSFWAAIAQVRENKEHVRNLFRILFRIVTIASVAAAGMVYLFNEAFLVLWMGREVSLGDIGMILVCVNLVFISLISFMGWILTTLHGEEDFARMSIWTAWTNLGTGLLATWKLGIIGPLVGSLVGYVLIKFVWIGLNIAKRLELNPLEVFRIAAPPLICSALFFSASQYLFPISLLNLSWLSLFQYATPNFFAFAILSWFFLLKSDERKLLQSKIKRGPA